MKINLEYSLDSEIPFQSLEHLSFQWELNRHATMEITGTLTSNCPDSVWSRNYRGTGMKLYQNRIGDEDQILFYGLIQTVDFVRNHGISEAHIRVSSASAKLDDSSQKLCEVFQDSGQSYSEIVRQIVKKKSGSVICTIGKEAISRPIICYQETEWEFLKRIASHQGGYLISDIKTGKPSLWFGMRNGKKISEEIRETSLEIEIKRDYRKKEEKARKSYTWKSNHGYSIGDWVQIDGKKYVIYEVEARFEHGVLNFIYKLSVSTDLETQCSFNESFVGMSLWGTVEEAKGETVRITFDIDKKEGKWFYPWRPETGNSLYAVPEVGSNVAVYFMDHADGSGIAVRCLGRSPENQKPEDKSMVTSTQGEIELFAGGMSLEKEKEQMEISDFNRINVSGNAIEMEATGKIKIQARRITLNAASEIRATAE